MLSARTLTQLRMYAERTLTGRCTLVDQTMVRDDQGGSQISETETHDVPCLVLGSSTAKETAVPAGVESQAVVPILFAVGTALTTQSRIKVGTAEYEIVGLDGRTNQALMHVECVRVK